MSWNPLEFFNKVQIAKKRLFEVLTYDFQATYLINLKVGEFSDAVFKKAMAELEEEGRAESIHCGNNIVKWIRGSSNNYREIIRSPENKSYKPKFGLRNPKSKWIISEEERERRHIQQMKKKEIELIVEKEPLKPQSEYTKPTIPKSVQNMFMGRVSKPIGERFPIACPDLSFLDFVEPGVKEPQFLQNQLLLQGSQQHL